MVANGRMGGVFFWFGFVLIAAAGLRPFAANAAPDPKAARAATAQLEQAVSAINAIEGEHKALTASITELRSQVSDLQRALGDLREEIRQKQEAAHGAIDQTLTQIKEMREEVRGLYVESSGIKGDVAQAVKQVDALDENLDSFRLSAGIIVAVVIVLQLVLMGLALRSRG